MKYTIKDDRIEADLEHGKLVVSSNTELGFKPVELLVTSVASCSGAVFRSIMRKQRVDYESFTIEASVERNETEANRVTKMLLHFKVTGKDLNEKRLEKNLKLVRRHCGMLRSVDGSIEVEEKLTVVQQ